MRKTGILIILGLVILMSIGTASATRDYLVIKERTAPTSETIQSGKDVNFKVTLEKSTNILPTSAILYISTDLYNPHVELTIDGSNKLFFTQDTIKKSLDINSVSTINIVASGKAPHVDNSEKRILFDISTRVTYENNNSPITQTEYEISFPHNIENPIVKTSTIQPLEILNPRIIFEHIFGQNYQVYIIGDVRNNLDIEVSNVQVYGVTYDKWGNPGSDPRSPLILRLKPGASAIFNLSYGLGTRDPEGHVDHYTLEARSPDITDTYPPLLITKPPQTTPPPTTTTPTITPPPTTLPPTTSPPITTPTPTLPSTTIPSTTVPIQTSQKSKSRLYLIGGIIFLDRKSTRLNSSHIPLSRMPSSA